MNKLQKQLDDLAKKALEDTTMEFTLPDSKEFVFLFRLAGKRVKIRTKIGLWLLNVLFKHIIGLPMGLKCTGDADLRVPIDSEWCEGSMKGADND